MNHLFSDLRYGARLLVKSKLTSTAAILSLALGIGGTTAMFSVVDAVLLRPLPYSKPERLLMVWATSSRPISSITGERRDRSRAWRRSWPRP
jgi:putative ABC transport system permease protein